MYYKLQMLRALKRFVRVLNSICFLGRQAFAATIDQHLVPIVSDHHAQVIYFRAAAKNPPDG